MISSIRLQVRKKVIKWNQNGLYFKDFDFQLTTGLLIDIEEFSSANYQQAMQKTNQLSLNYIKECHYPKFIL